MSDETKAGAKSKAKSKPRGASRKPKSAKSARPKSVAAKPLADDEQRPKAAAPRKPSPDFKPRGESKPHSKQPPRPFNEAGDSKARDYTLQCFNDKSLGKFVGAVLEFPDLSITGDTREDVIRDIYLELENKIDVQTKKGEPLPEPLHSRKYPDKLEVHVSQNLFRRLDQVSRSERVSLDQLVIEMISAGVEKRFSSQRAQAARPFKQDAQQPRRHQHQQNNRGGNNQHQRRGGGQHQQNNRGGNSSGLRDMDNRENFMEYVRRLEKGGWKKR